MNQLNKSVESFLASYLQAWKSLDASAITSHYIDGANIFDGDGAGQYSLSELVTKFERNCQDMKKMAFQTVTAEVLVNEPDGNALDVFWTVSFANGELQFGTRYRLVSINARTLIHSASVYSI